MKSIFGLFVFFSITSGLADPIRLGLVVDSRFAEAEALLLAGLSKDPQFAMVERNELQRVLSEQSLQLSSATARQSIVIGEMVGANALLIVQPGDGEKPDNGTVTVLGVETGVVLGRERFLRDTLVEQGLALLAHCSPKLRVAREEVIPLSILSSANPDQRYAREQGALLTGLILRLSAEPAVFVLERERLETLADDQFISPDGGESLWSGALLLEVSIGLNPHKQEEWMAAFTLRKPDGGIAEQWTIQRSTPDELQEPAAIEVLKRLKVPSGSGQWSRKDEIEIFRKRLNQIRKREWRAEKSNEASRLATTLYMLGDRSSWVWLFYANAPFQEAFLDPKLARFNQYNVPPMDAVTRDRGGRAILETLQRETERMTVQLAKTGKERTAWKDNYSLEAPTMATLLDTAPLFLEAVHEQGGSLEIAPFPELQAALRDVVALYRKAGYPEAHRAALLPRLGLSELSLRDHYKSFLETRDMSRAFYYPSETAAANFAWDDARKARFAETFRDDLLQWMQNGPAPLRLNACLYLRQIYREKFHNVPFTENLISILEQMNDGFARGEFPPVLREDAIKVLGPPSLTAYHDRLIAMTHRLINTAQRNTSMGWYGLPRTADEAKTLLDAMDAASRRLNQPVMHEYRNRILKMFPAVVDAKTKSENDRLPFRVIWKDEEITLPGGSDRVRVQGLGGYSIEENTFYQVVMFTGAAPGPPAFGLMTIDIARGAANFERLPTEIEERLQKVESPATRFSQSRIIVTPKAIALLPVHHKESELWVVKDRNLGTWKTVENPHQPTLLNSSDALVGDVLVRAYERILPFQGKGIQQLDFSTGTSYFTEVPDQTKWYYLYQMPGSHDLLVNMSTGGSGTYLIFESSGRLFRPATAEEVLSWQMGGAATRTRDPRFNEGDQLMVERKGADRAWMIKNDFRRVPGTPRIEADFQQEFATMSKDDLMVLRDDKWENPNHGDPYACSWPQGILLSTAQGLYFGYWREIVPAEEPARACALLSPALNFLDEKGRALKCFTAAEHLQVQSFDPTSNRIIIHSHNFCAAGVVGAPFDEWVPTFLANVDFAAALVPGEAKALINIHEEGLHLWDLATRTMERIEGTKGGQNLTVSPNGKYAAFNSGSELCVLDIKERKVLRASPPCETANRNMIWSGDSKYLVARIKKECKVLELDDTGFAVTRTLGDLRVFDFLADGISFVGVRQKGKEREIVMSSLLGFNERVLAGPFKEVLKVLTDRPRPGFLLAMVRYTGATWHQNIEINIENGAVSPFPLEVQGLKRAQFCPP